MLLVMEKGKGVEKTQPSSPSPGPFPPSRGPPSPWLGPVPSSQMKIWFREENNQATTCIALGMKMTSIEVNKSACLA